MEIIALVAIGILVVLILSGDSLSRLEEESKRYKCPNCHKKEGKWVLCGLDPISGSVVDNFNFTSDDEGNLYVSSYNRECLACAHVWYVPCRPDDDPDHPLPEWDRNRLKPKRVPDLSEFVRK